MENNTTDRGNPVSETVPEVSHSQPSAWKAKARALWGGLDAWQKRMALFVGVPTVLVFLYLALFASPMYVSEAKFAVRSATEQAAGLDFASQIFKTASSTTQDAAVVTEYIESPDAFERLDKELAVKAHYCDRRWDVISRLTQNPTLYDKTAFWNFVASPVLDPDTGIVTFTVRAYTPEMAQKIASHVLKQSEALVNAMNERAREDAMKLAGEEVKRAQARLTKSQKALETFRDEHAEIDPKATASGLQTLVMDLEGQRATLKAQISEMAAYMRPDAPALKTLKTRLAAVEKQLSGEKQRLAGIGAGAMNNWVSAYEALTIENEFAQKQLVSAMTAMESARVSLLSQSKYVVTIESPTLPDESRYPRTFEFTFCVLLGLLLLFGLGSLIVASIREHAGF